MSNTRQWLDEMSKAASSDGTHITPPDADVVVFGELKNLEKDIPVRINYLTSLIDGDATYGEEQSGGYWRGKRDAYQEVMAVLAPGEMDKGIADILLEAAERNKQVVAAKALISESYQFDTEGLRHISIDKLVDAVNSLDVDVLRRLILDHHYRGGSLAE